MSNNQDKKISKEISGVRRIFRQNIKTPNSQNDKIEEANNISKQEIDDVNKHNTDDIMKRKIVNRHPLKNNQVTNYQVTNYQVNNQLSEYNLSMQNYSNDVISVHHLGKNGRLGNQMFQIASAMGIARKNGADLLLPFWYCNYTQKNMSDFFENKLPQSDVFPSSMIFYQEENFNYDSNIPIKGSYFLRGYYQNERYFEDIKNEIFFYFSPSDIIEKGLRYKYNDLLNKETCSVHIRRGDYVNHPIHGVCDMDYYKRGMDYVKTLKGDQTYFIFSDDIEWCKQNLKGDNNVYVENNLDIEDLFLMSMCKNHVISNSSFSWWGSWICRNPQKSIIAPKNWFTPSAKIDQSGIHTKQMIKI